MKFWIFLNCLFFAGILKGQILVSSTSVTSTTLSTLNFYLILAGVPPGTLSSDLKYDVDTYKLTYFTTDVHGNQTIASGAIMVPKAIACDSFSLMLYAHGTVLKKEDVPSRNKSEAIVGQAFASIGRVVVCPDYLGLGDNPGLHPYLHTESEATACIDMMRAAREFVKDSLPVSLTGEVLVSGYSQGGHAAMATLKYIQDNSLSNEFNIVAGGPGAGAYNLSGAMKDMIFLGPYSNPGYICYLLFGLNEVYGNLFINYSDILKSPYDQTIPPYFDGTHSMDSLNAQLPNNILDFIQDSVIANFKADSVQKKHPLWQALLANDNYDWKPEFPLEIYYCTLDEQVIYQNALDAEAAMLANGADSVKAVFAGNKNHGDCAVPALVLTNEFFKRKEKKCDIGIEERYQQHDIYLYPNPTNRLLYVKGIRNRVEMVFYHINGGEVKRQWINPNESISIENLARGLYSVSVISDEFTKLQKLIIN